jgi:predicted membrane protein
MRKSLVSWELPCRSMFVVLGLLHQRPLLNQGLISGLSVSRKHWIVNCYQLHQEIEMPLVNIVIALIVVGMGLYLINRFIPMASSIKTILNVVVVVAVSVWVLQAAGLWGPISSYRLTR